MSVILGLDPGNEISAAVVWDPDGRRVIDHALLDNEAMRFYVAKTFDPVEIMAIEMIASYGMAVGKTVFDTCVWIGRFMEVFSGRAELEYRKDVKMFLCNSMRAKDANVRQAVMDMFGSTRRKAIGLKKSPGPLYGIKKDLWQALAVAITYSDSIAKK